MWESNAYRKFGGALHSFALRLLVSLDIGLVGLL
jgi:hypothetical protein